MNAVLVFCQNPRYRAVAAVFLIALYGNTPMAAVHPRLPLEVQKVRVDVLLITDKPPRLRAVLTNESFETIRIDGNCLPAREGGCGLNLLAIAEHGPREPLKQLVVPSNAPGEIKIAPKEKIRAELVLETRFPALKKLREDKSALLFWWYQPLVAVEGGQFVKQPHQGGLIVLPKTKD
jgi:hypothetical protein